MSNEGLYRERLERVRKAVRVEPVDRIPVIYMGVAFAPRYMGMSMAKFVTDWEAAVEVTLAALDRLNSFGGVDGVNLAYTVNVPSVLSALWLSRVRVPGRELPPDSLWQVHEAEVMAQDEYDVIIEKGWKAFLAAYMPRVVDMEEFGAAMAWSRANTPRILQMYREHGYVVVSDGPLMPTIPFELLCGARSMSKFIIDLHRIPDKVQAAMDVILAETLADVAAAPPAVPSSIGGVWVGGWRSASALLAPKLWNRFVWPYFVRIVEALVAKGYTPVLHWDQDWTRDLARLQELPPKKCVLNPDGMTDLRKFKELVGDRMAVMGDVPASLLVAGTPDDIYGYVRDLVRDIGPTGLLLCPGCDAPMNTKPENMEAFIAAANEYGRGAA